MDNLWRREPCDLRQVRKSGTASSSASQIKEPDSIEWAWVGVKLLVPYPVIEPVLIIVTWK